MDIIIELWSRSINFFNIPNTRIFLGIFLIVSLLSALIKQNRFHLRTLMPFLFLIFSVWLFGGLPIVGLLVFGVLSYLVGAKMFQLPWLISFLAGFFALIELAIIFTLLFDSLSIGFSLTFFLASVYVLVFSPHQTRADLAKGKLGLLRLIQSLSITDWTLLAIAFVLGSVPQTHWDAVQANLYISKWYVITDSLSPLKEAISSLFPQNSQIYYAFFYKLGGLKLLQLAYFLPFFLTILLLREYSSIYKLGVLSRLLIFGVLLTPITIFQASSGYYDNLVLLLIFSAAITLFSLPAKLTFSRALAAALFVGFAAGTKYFPLIMMPIPVAVYLFKGKITSRVLLRSLFIVLVTLTPLFIWLSRSYSYTHSPVFPFFQTYFPTPDYWDPSNHLEENFMIQTTMTVRDWLQGGMFTYPFLSYFHASQFIEGTKGYPGVIYLAFLPIQAIVLFLTLFKLLKSRRLSRPEQFMLLAFFMYAGVGTVVRYYRYLWPFQFLWFISSIPVLHTAIAHQSRVKLFLSVYVLLFLPISFINLIEYYRYYPLDMTKLFKADYHFTQQANSSPMSYLNTHSSEDDLVLDNAQFPVMRLHFRPRVYQCSWYWINGLREIGNPTVFAHFRYLITSNPPTLTNSYCTSYLNNFVQQAQLVEVYQDDYYLIYQNNN